MSVEQCWGWWSCCSLLLTKKREVVVLCYISFNKWIIYGIKRRFLRLLYQSKKQKYCDNNSPGLVWCSGYLLDLVPGSGWGWSQWPAALTPLWGHSGSGCGTGQAGPDASDFPVRKGTLISGSLTSWGSAELWAVPAWGAAAGFGSHSDSESPASSASRSHWGGRLRTETQQTSGCYCTDVEL